MARGALAEMVLVLFSGITGHDHCRRIWGVARIPYIMDVAGRARRLAQLGPVRFCEAVELRRAHGRYSGHGTSPSRARGHCRRVGAWACAIERVYPYPASCV